MKKMELKLIEGPLTLTREIIEGETSTAENVLLAACELICLMFSQANLIEAFHSLNPETMEHLARE